MSYRGTVRFQQMTGRMARALPEPAVPAGPARGTRVRLVRCSDPYTKLRPGALGTVSFVDALGTVHIDWDSGSNLGLVPGEDAWEIVG